MKRSDRLSHVVGILPTKMEILLVDPLCCVCDALRYLRITVRSHLVCDGEPLCCVCDALRYLHITVDHTVVKPLNRLRQLLSPNLSEQ